MPGAAGGGASSSADSVGLVGSVTSRACVADVVRERVGGLDLVPPVTSFSLRSDRFINDALHDDSTYYCWDRITLHLQVPPIMVLAEGSDRTCLLGLACLVPPP